MTEDSLPDFDDLDDEINSHDTPPMQMRSKGIPTSSALPRSMPPAVNNGMASPERFNNRPETAQNTIAYDSTTYNPVSPQQAIQSRTASVIENGQITKYDPQIVAEQYERIMKEELAAEHEFSSQPISSQTGPSTPENLNNFEEKNESNKNRKPKKNKDLNKEPKTKMPKHRIEPPEKHKGKIILEYGDGNRRIRPPMTQLIQHNHKLAWHAFTEEYSDSIRVWWDKYRYTPKVLAVIFGMLIGLSISAAWFFIVPFVRLIPQIPQTDYNDLIIFIVALLSVSFSSAAVISLTISALLSRRKDFKTMESEDIHEEGFINTVFRFIIVAFYYGPIFIVVLLISLFFGLLNFASAVAKAT